MNITYVFHSCYTVELSRHFLVFDYYRGVLPPIPADKRPMFFVSHAHYDHFQPEIWSWSEKRPETLFVVDQGVAHPQLPQIHTVTCNREYTVEELQVRTLRSTDEGVAFLLCAEGKALYHAGDLNWWHWEGAPDRENEHHQKAFFHELKKLRGSRLDAAFLPLDPRQGANAWWGAKAFLDAVAVAHAFPMHFGDAVDAMNRTISEALTGYPMLHTVSQEGQAFRLED